MFGVGVVSCSEPGRIEQTAILVDATVEESSYNPERMSVILNEMASGTVYFGVIDDQSLGFDTTLIKVDAPAYLSSSKLEDQTKKKKDLNNIQRLSRKLVPVSKQYDESYIASKVFGFANRMATSDIASQKTLWAFTDGLEHNSQVSFYKTFQNKGSLMNSFEELKEKLENEFDDSPGTRWDGIDFIFIHTAKSESDQHLRECRKFWKMYCLQRGAKSVDFRVHI